VENPRGFSRNETIAKHVDPLKKDSIVITRLNGNINGVYKRLADSLKDKSPEFKLTSKKYIQNYGEWIDTIHLVND